MTLTELTPPPPFLRGISSNYFAKMWMGVGRKKKTTSTCLKGRFFVYAERSYRDGAIIRTLFSEIHFGNQLW